MRTVLYTDDMEPITVLELDRWMMDRLRVGTAINVPVFRQMDFIECPTPETVLRFDQVTIFAERIHRKGCYHLILITKDEESAMLLKSVFLAGQQAEVNKIYESGAARGFIEGLRIALR